MSKKRATPSNGQKQPSVVKFDYIKSNFFRVIHADGAWGGITPTGHIQVAFWNERPPIPKQLEFEVTPEGGIGDETKRVGRDAVVREVEVNVVMNLLTAKTFVNWLQDKIKKVEERTDAESK
jgi:hypothetical protein